MKKILNFKINTMVTLVPLLIIFASIDSYAELKKADLYVGTCINSSGPSFGTVTYKIDPYGYPAPVYIHLVTSSLADASELTCSTWTNTCGGLSLANSNEGDTYSVPLRLSDKSNIQLVFPDGTITCETPTE